MKAASKKQGNGGGGEGGAVKRGASGSLNDLSFISQPEDFNKKGGGGRAIYEKFRY